MIKAHISNGPEVKSFSLIDGGMFILQRFTTPPIRRKLLCALYWYWNRTCAGRVAKTKERKCRLISSSVFNKRPRNQKHRWTCEEVPIHINRWLLLHAKQERPKEHREVGASKYCPLVLCRFMPVGDLIPYLTGTSHNEDRVEVLAKKPQYYTEQPHSELDPPHW